MDSMIRKQIYIQHRRQAIINRMARRLGVSEAEISEPSPDSPAPVTGPR